MSGRRPRKPKRFGPEWWACYAAAYAVERRGGEDAREAMGQATVFDRERCARFSTAERASLIADDAIMAFAEIVDDGCVLGDDFAELPSQDSLV